MMSVNHSVEFANRVTVREEPFSAYHLQSQNLLLYQPPPKNEKKKKKKKKNPVRTVSDRGHSLGTYFEKHVVVEINSTFKHSVEQVLRGSLDSGLQFQIPFDSLGSSSSSNTSLPTLALTTMSLLHTTSWDQHHD
jgi:hypothetical protein